MTRFAIGDDRSQSTLFPERLDDYLSEDNPVRAIDVFVDELDLGKLGFGGVAPEARERVVLRSKAPGELQAKNCRAASPLLRLQPRNRARG
jgi:hypothetical protein